MPVTSEDAALITRCLAGEQQAVRALVQKFQTLVFSVCYRMLGHRQDAEDVSQDVFLRVFRSLKSWDSSRPFKPWLLAIACNRCKTVLEKRGRRPVVADFVDEIATEAPRTSEDLAEELQRALETLREEYRTCFILFYQQELSVLEISDVMTTPEGTIKTWLHRARKELADLLQRRGIGPETCYEMYRL